MTRARNIAIGEYYHVYNRATNKRGVFTEKEDRMRFLFLILYAQSPLTFLHITRIVRAGSLAEGFPLEFEVQEKITRNRFVELVAFSLMPNHFHLLVKEKDEGGVSKYAQRLQLGYTKYFNERYSSSGHVFQGRYQSVRVRDNRQLMYLSAYIHRNPRELKEWREREEAYPYSSLQDYVDKNRWGGLLATDIIASQFEGTAKSNYRDFVRTSTAKILTDELEGLSL